MEVQWNINVQALLNVKARQPCQWWPQISTGGRLTSIHCARSKFQRSKLTFNTLCWHVYHRNPALNSLGTRFSIVLHYFSHSYKHEKAQTKKQSEMGKMRLRLSKDSLEENFNWRTYAHYHALQNKKRKQNPNPLSSVFSQDAVCCTTTYECTIIFLQSLLLQCTLVSCGSDEFTVFRNEIYLLWAMVQQSSRFSEQRFASGKHRTSQQLFFKSYN